MPDSNLFQIRIVASMSAFFVDGITFDILDVSNQLLAIYNYQGVGHSVGLPISASGPGDWNFFRTPRPMNVGGFGGFASFASAGAADIGRTAFVLSPLFHPSIRFAPFATGFTVGAGYGLGAGIFDLMFPPIAAAQAPWPHAIR